MILVVCGGARGRAGLRVCVCACAHVVGCDVLRVWGRPRLCARLGRPVVVLVVGLRVCCRWCIIHRALMIFGATVSASPLWSGQHYGRTTAAADAFARRYQHGASKWCRMYASSFWRQMRCVCRRCVSACAPTAAFGSGSLSAAVGFFAVPARRHWNPQRAGFLGTGWLASSAVRRGVREP